MARKHSLADGTLYDATRKIFLILSIPALYSSRIALAVMSYVTSHLVRSSVISREGCALYLPPNPAAIINGPTSGGAQCHCNHRATKPRSSPSPRNHQPNLLHTLSHPSILNIQSRKGKKCLDVLATAPTPPRPRTVIPLPIICLRSRPGYLR